MNYIVTLFLPIVLHLLTIGAEAILLSFAVTGRQINPGISDSALEVYIDGQLKHWVRNHLGFMGFTVDLLWDNAEVQKVTVPFEVQAVSSTKTVPPPGPSAPIMGNFGVTLTNG